MRVTNNMIMNNANNNINGTKILVDKGNTQMTTQKKIQRPSEDPVVAVRGLRLQTSLSKINQYYEKNIPDAEAWMEVTETALNNINEELKEFRTLCVYGSTDTLTQEDRNTIREQLQSLQQAVFSQGNADYAGRTVFTGYRTDKQLVFSKNEATTRYNITQQFSADNFEKMRYYNKEVTVPTNYQQINQLGSTEALSNKNFSINRDEYSRLRLGYDGVSNLRNLTFSYTDASGNYYSGSLANLDPTDSNKLDPLSSQLSRVDNDADARREVVDENIQPGSYTDPFGNSVTYNYQEISSGYTKTPGNVPNTDPAQQYDIPQAAPSKIYVFDSEEDWGMWSTGKTGDDGKYVPDDAMVIIKSTGDLIFGKTVASTMAANHVSVEVQYEKEGFDSGELRPEYYYDCVDVSDPINKKKYAKEDVRYDINYTIAQNQTLTVNTEGIDVFDGAILQDMKDMLSAVDNAMEAYDKLQKIQEMKKDTSYQDEKTQAKLDEWEALAQKEFDNYSDHMSKLYSALLGNADEYIDKNNLALTRLGCRMDQLKMTESRMDEQQQTVQDLQSKNDDVDLSDIVIKYMASYTAYQSSLQAAGKLGQQSLLNYI